MKNKFLSILVPILFVMFSCNSGAKKDEKSLDEVSMEDTKEIISSIPAPNSLDIMNALNDAGAPYIYDITNEASFVDNYMSTKQKAFGLGVYCTDLSYLITYNQQDIIPEYIKSLYKLTEGLEISTSEFKRMENNIDNKDSLEIIVKKLFARSNEYLNSNKKIDIALYILASSWVETIYLTDKIIEFSGNQKPLIKIILDNKKSFYKVVELFEQRKNDNNFSHVYDKLNNMQQLFEQIVKNPEDSASVEKLRSSVREFRSEII